MVMNKFVYTIKHRNAVVKLEKELIGKISIRGFLHDLDKIFLYLFMSKKRAGKIHRYYYTIQEELRQIATLYR